MNRELVVAIAVGTAAMAWVGYADHPSARNLRKAMIATLQALLA